MADSNSTACTAATVEAPTVTPEYKAHVQRVYAVLKEITRGDIVSLRTIPRRGETQLNSHTFVVDRVWQLAGHGREDLDIRLSRTDKDVGEVRITVLKDAMLPVAYLGEMGVEEVHDVIVVAKAPKYVRSRCVLC